MRNPRWLGGLLVLAATRASAAPDAAIEEMSIEDLLATPVEVATQTARNIRETPGIVTVFSREELQKSGARNLADVLARVPGLWFGADVSGVTGLGFRGLWGHEGKILLRIDGQELNENLYSTLQFGNRYPVDEIERIEVIRGPGSVVYAGYAELAVIDVTTRGNGDRQGVSASIMAGAYPSELGRVNADVAGGKKFANGVDVGGEVAVGYGNRSSGTYFDNAGGSASMAHGGSREQPFYANLSGGTKDLRVRLLVDSYAMTFVDGYDTAQAAPVAQTFLSANADLRWTAHPWEAISLTTRLNFKHQVPWKSVAPEELLYDKTAQRATVAETLNWQAKEKLWVLAGVEGSRDAGSLNSLKLVGFQTQFGDANAVSYLTGAAFAQVLWDTPFANIAAGGRFEHHSKAGNSAVPRLAFTKVVDRFHAKLLASGSYRAPGIENLNVGRDVLPERTWTFEGEAGYQFGDHVFASVNLFQTTILDPIVYTYDETAGQGYINGSRTGSRGVELDTRFRSRRISGGIAGSYATTKGLNDVATYAVPGDASVLLGLPPWKGVGWVDVAAAEKVNVEASAIVIGERAAFLPDGAGGARLGRLPANAIVNAFVSVRDVGGLRGLALGVGAYNLLNRNVPVAQPYDGGHAPLPGAPRELLVRLSWDAAPP